MKRIVIIILVPFLSFMIISCDNINKPKKAQSSPGIDAKYFSILTDENSLSNGKVIYDENCAVCHGKDGGGVVGPNFADEYWIYGNTMEDLFPIVLHGVYEKGMIAYKSKFNNKQIQDVMSYIFALQGNTVENPKSPEGKKY